MSWKSLDENECQFRTHRRTYINSFTIVTLLTFCTFVTGYNPLDISTSCSATIIFFSPSLIWSTGRRLSLSVSHYINNTYIVHDISLLHNFLVNVFFSLFPYILCIYIDISLYHYQSDIRYLLVLYQRYRLTEKQLITAIAIIYLIPFIYVFMPYIIFTTQK